MERLKNLINIPKFVVKENQKPPFLKVKDHSVSGESFELFENRDYGFLETLPQPSPDKLFDYYKSEDYISHTDSKRNLFEYAYHLVRKISLKQKLKLVNSFASTNKSLLDIGCGTGDFLKEAKNNHWNVFGVEPNMQARNIANIKTNNSVFNTEQLSKFEPQSFNVITLWHVLEHLPNLEEQVQTFKKLLKPNGTLIIAVPNYKSYDAIYYKEYWAGFDVPWHLWHFNKTCILKLASNVSMEVVKTKPMYFDAFYVSMLSEKYKNGNMNFFKGFFVGFMSNIKSLKTKEASSLIYIIKNS